MFSRISWVYCTSYLRISKQYTFRRFKLNFFEECRNGVVGDRRSLFYRDYHNRNSVTFFGCKHVYAQKVRMYIVHELVNSPLCANILFSLYRLLNNTSVSLFSTGIGPFLFFLSWNACGKVINMKGDSSAYFQRIKRLMFTVKLSLCCYSLYPLFYLFENFLCGDRSSCLFPSFIVAWITQSTYAFDFIAKNLINKRDSWENHSLECIGDMTF